MVRAGEWKGQGTGRGKGGEKGRGPGKIGRNEEKYTTMKHKRVIKQTSSICFSLLFTGKLGADNKVSQ